VFTTALESVHIRASSCGYDDVLASLPPRIPVFHLELESVVVNKACEGVELDYARVHKQVLDVDIQTFDVALNVADHFLPVESFKSVLAIVQFSQVPARLPDVVAQLALEAGGMHKFLGDAADVHASPADPPGCALIRGLYEICQSNFVATSRRIPREGHSS